MTYHKHFRGRDQRAVTLQDMERAWRPLEKLGPLAQREKLYELLEPQLLELYSFIETLPGGQFDPYPEPRAPAIASGAAPLLPGGPQAGAVPGDGDGEAAEERRRALAEAEARRGQRELLDKAVPHPGGFRLRVRRSTVEHPEAGFGLVAEGHVLPGTLVALYPGVVYFPVDPLGDGRDLADALREHMSNPYLISRYDDIIIDGRDWHLRALKLKRQIAALREAGARLADGDEETSSSRQGGDARLAKYRNPYAVANFINHPPRGKAPNVMIWSYTYREQFPLHLRKFIPNEYARPPRLLDLLDPNVVMPGIVCVAVRHIVNEELFLNYRLNPRWAAEHPSWYHQPDAESAELRRAPLRRWHNPFR